MPIDLLLELELIEISRLQREVMTVVMDYVKTNISFAETLAIEAEAMGEYTEAQILYSNAALEARKANYFKDHERLSAKAKEMFGLVLINEG